MKQHRKIALLPAVIGGIVAASPAFALENGHELEIKARALYWNNDEYKSPGNSSNNKSEQTALGTQINYRSPYYAGKLGFNASVYNVTKIGQAGPQKTNLLEIDNSNQLQNAYTSLAEAYVKFNHDDWINARYGRQVHNSLLLKSTTTRAVPDTFSGAAFEVSPNASLKLYGAMYDEWRARSTGTFEKFRTESSPTNPSAGRIDYVQIAGMQYKAGAVDLNAEYLNSRKYLTKLGLVGGYTLPVWTDTLKLSAGVFNTRDAGDLFVCGAETEFDCTGTGRLKINSNAYYLDADWKMKNLTLGAAVAKFDGMWIEDNFAVNAYQTGKLTTDHGTNPFPTSASLGPDLANNGETVWSGRVSYDWKDIVPGLKTAYKYAKGSGARRSHIDDATRASERYGEFTLDYAVPFISGLSVKYVFMDYASRVKGTTAINGVPRADWEQQRLYLDYVYKF